MDRTLSAEAVPGHPDFRPLARIPGVRVDLRYASRGNFTGRDLYSPLDCAWLHCDAAASLARSAQWLAREREGASLLVLDAMRPQRVQEQLWAALQGTDLLRYLAEPDRGSIHSFGMAVDVTVADAQGRELDMGTPFDSLDERSHPALEEGHLVTGAILPAQVRNRELLRAAMREGGWMGISTEWWHFDCGDRLKVRAGYARIL
ncbi:MAG: M15 family metallopeptidase [Betaproteobacteria bacterium]|nr:M15 family metallopeptidase [Betaproteobacteria bacterium]